MAWPRHDARCFEFPTKNSDGAGRSQVFNLAPLGRHTSQLESLINYLQRLAGQHRLSVPDSSSKLLRSYGAGMGGQLSSPIGSATTPASPGFSSVRPHASIYTS